MVIIKRFSTHIYRRFDKTYERKIKIHIYSEYNNIMMVEYNNRSVATCIYSVGFIDPTCQKEIARSSDYLICIGSYGWKVVLVNVMVMLCFCQVLRWVT